LMMTKLKKNSPIYKKILIKLLQQLPAKWKKLIDLFIVYNYRYLS
jgi:hypothetical protein